VWIELARENTLAAFFEYFLAYAMSRDFSPRQANPGLEVSAKHRMAQRFT
jgi:hypothetical protein